MRQGDHGDADVALDLLGACLFRPISSWKFRPASSTAVPLLPCRWPYCIHAASARQHELLQSSFVCFPRGIGPRPKIKTLVPNRRPRLHLPLLLDLPCGRACAPSVWGRSAREIMARGRPPGSCRRRGGSWQSDVPGRPAHHTPVETAREGRDLNRDGRVGPNAVHFGGPTSP